LFGDRIHASVAIEILLSITRVCIVENGNSLCISRYLTRRFSVTSGQCPSWPKSVQGRVNECNRDFRQLSSETPVYCRRRGSQACLSQTWMRRRMFWCIRCATMIGGRSSVDGGPGLPHGPATRPARTEVDESADVLHSRSSRSQKCVMVSRANTPS